MLSRVLLAYSTRNKVVGYCQVSGCAAPLHVLLHTCSPANLCA